MLQRVPEDPSEAPGALDTPVEPLPLGHSHEPDNDVLPDKPQPDPV